VNGGWLDSVCLQAPPVNSGAVPEPESQQPTNDESEAPDAPAAFGSGIAWRSRALHIFALSGFAVAQPLLGLLGSEPGFWIAREATYVDVALFLAVVVLLIPATVLGVEWLISLANESVSLVVHFIAVAGFVFLISLNVIDTLASGALRGAVVVLAAGLAAVAITAMYIRFRGLREFVSILAVGPIVFVVLFVIGLPPLGGSDAPTLDAGIDSSTSVVLVVLDEFQLAALLNDDGTIDRTKYPNIGRLADMSTFYPNATTVHDNSLKAVPSILTGQHPRPDQEATAEDHPLSIFTVLGGTHGMVVNEDFTQVCPQSLCEDSRPPKPTADRMQALASDSAVVYLHTIVPTKLLYRLPPIGTRWEGFLTTETAPTRSDSDPDGEAVGPIEQEIAILTGSERRAVDYGAFLDALDPNLGPTLFYLHVDIPHAPWSYSPSGRPYPYSDTIPGYLPSGMWKSDPWYTQQAYERFLLNSGFADDLVGRTLDRLEELAMLDDVVLVFLSDHGENFAVDEPRRLLADENFAAIAGLPLFVKYPGQVAGRVDDRNAQIIDVLPTIVEILGGSIDGMDGVSLLVDDPPTMKHLVSNWDREFNVPLDEYRALAREFLSEAHSVLPSGVGFEGVYAAVGPRSDLNGRAVGEFAVTEVAGNVVVKTGEFFNNFDPDGLFDPLSVPAEVTVDGGGLPVFYAVVVNGVIRSTITADAVNGDTATIYGIVPPDSYRPGANTVEILGIVGDPGATTLQRYS